MSVLQARPGNRAVHPVQDVSMLSLGVLRVRTVAAVRVPNHLLIAVASVPDSTVPVGVQVLDAVHCRHPRFFGRAGHHSAQHVDPA